MGVARAIPFGRTSQLSNVFQPLNLPIRTGEPYQFFRDRIIAVLRAPFVGYGRIPVETVIVSERYSYEDRLLALHDCLPVCFAPRIQHYTQFFGIGGAWRKAVLVFCANFLFSKNTHLRKCFSRNIQRCFYISRWQEFPRVQHLKHQSPFAYLASRRPKDNVRSLIIFPQVVLHPSHPSEYATEKSD
jgi:hypothetical protein